MSRFQLFSSDLTLFVAAMAVVVVASNILVQFPVMAFGLEDYLTWGAFSYPFAFFVTDLTNRRFGAVRARSVVYAGFALAVALSVVFSTPRIAVASGLAFLCAQLLDIVIFDSLRESSWWRAPFLSSVISSALDTMLFFSLAFAGEDLPWVNWAIADYGVKLALAAVFVPPYGVLRSILPAYRARAAD